MTGLLVRWRVGRGLAFAALALCLALGLGGERSARGADVPPAPSMHVTDYANVTSPSFRAQLSAELEAFERSDSTQILAVIFQKLPAGEHMESYTHRLAEAWGVGRKGENNGAVLFLFVDDRRMRIEVGYGLEPKLTDALSRSILGMMTPRLKVGDYEGAVRVGVTSMVQAVQGTFKGTGRAGRRPTSSQSRLGAFFAFFLLLAVIQILSRRRGYVYGRGKRSSWRGSGWGMGGGFGGGFRGGGGFGGGGGFSGGGGSFGGGGASGSW